MRFTQTLSLATVAITALLTFLAAPVQAQATFSGALAVTDPKFNRPIANNNNPPTTLSGTGTAVYYDVQPFYVSVTGGYNMLVTPTGFDSYLIIYKDSFNPASSLTNCVAANDDFPSTTLSGFTSLNLTAGVQYFFVTSSFSNNATGAYTDSIGTVTQPSGANVSLGIVVVPEAGTVALVLPALAALGAVVTIRKRRR